MGDFEFSKIDLLIPCGRSEFFFNFSKTRAHEEIHDQLNGQFIGSASLGSGSRAPGSWALGLAAWLRSAQAGSARLSLIQLNLAWLRIKPYLGSILTLKLNRSPFCSNNFEFLLFINTFSTTFVLAKALHRYIYCSTEYIVEAISLLKLTFFAMKLKNFLCNHTIDCVD